MRVRLLSVVCAAALLASCGSLKVRVPVPEKETAQAQIPGIPNVRVVVHPFTADWSMLDGSFEGCVRRLAGPERTVTLLSLSGGGSNGAYGAGLLKGWTEKGDRPEFDIVTGISTGALIAPFAFLGSAYDAELEVAYTTVSDKDIFEELSIFGIMRRRDAVSRTEPMAALINKQMDDAKLEKIAAEHRKGRRLYVGTTLMDSQHLAVWDMGAIACSTHPDAPGLFRRVLQASASIPVAFPPVYIDVESGGQKYDEMHSDGGCMTQVFGASFLARVMALAKCIRGSLYLIRNAHLDPDWVKVEPKLSSIATRAMGTMIMTQGWGDLYRAYSMALAGRFTFNLAYIPAEFDADREGEFDKAYMRKLFDIGWQGAKGGFPWAKAPPGLLSTDK